MIQTNIYIYCRVYTCMMCNHDEFLLTLLDQIWTLSPPSRSRVHVDLKYGKKIWNQSTCSNHNIKYVCLWECMYICVCWMDVNFVDSHIIDFQLQINLYCSQPPYGDDLYSFYCCLILLITCICVNKIILNWKTF